MGRALHNTNILCFIDVSTAGVPRTFPSTALRYVCCHARRQFVCKCKNEYLMQTQTMRHRFSWPNAIAVIAITITIAIAIAIAVADQAVNTPYCCPTSTARVSPRLWLRPWPGAAQLRLGYNLCSHHALGNKLFDRCCCCWCCCRCCCPAGCYWRRPIL